MNARHLKAMVSIRLAMAIGKKMGVASTFEDVCIRGADVSRRAMGAIHAITQHKRRPRHRTEAVFREQ